MIKIDFKCFIRQHYWVGFFYWNDCKNHKHYNSDCKKCNSGKWRYIYSKGEKRRTIDYSSIGFKCTNVLNSNIFRMPMNNVVWLKDDE